MATTDWAFDMLAHIKERYAAVLGFTPDDHQRYPDRITGNAVSGRTVIIPKAVGSENAGRFRRWVTLPVGHWQNITARPLGWRYLVLMVGLLPDGEPWWSALYEESMLAEVRDHSEDKGGFYRFDPGLTGRALIADWDKDRPEQLPVPEAEEVPTDTRNVRGNRWQDQTLHRDTSVAQILKQVRMAAMSPGGLDRSSWDHDATDYDGHSNKQVKIAASMLLDRPEEWLSMDDAWAIVEETAGIG